MAKGESRYNPSDRQVKRFKFRTAPTSDYTLQSKQSFAVACASEPGSVPYVNGRLTLLNTKEEGVEDSRDILMFPKLFLQTLPNKEGGTPAVDMGGGLTELIQTLHLTLPEDIQPIVLHEGTEDETEALPAKKVAEWLNSLGEFVCRAHVKLRPAKGGFDANNQLDYWIEDEVNSKLEDSNVTPMTGTGGKKKK